MVSAFGIYACVQFIRGKSAKALLLALTFGSVVDVMGLVALPLVQPFLEEQDRSSARRQTTRSRRIRPRLMSV